MRTHRRILVIGDGCRRPASGCRQAEGFEGPAEIVAVQSRWTRAAIGQAFPPLAARGRAGGSAVHQILMRSPVATD